MRVTFLGLGLMGAPMARNIVTKGHALTVWNRTPGKTTELQSLGATVALTLREAVQDADVVITMVTAAEDLRELLFDDAGIAGHMKKDAVLIDMETIGPTAAREIATRLKDFDIDFVDAPVTGSTPKAKTGELSILVGAQASIFTRILPVLQAMGTNIHHVGDIGTGQAMKLVNNMIIAETVLAAAEGMLLADAMELPRARVADILRTLPASSGFMNLKLPNFVSDTYPLLFSLANMTKDIKLALAEMQKSGRHLPYLEHAVQLHEKAMKLGYGPEDNSMILKAFS